MGNNNSSFTQSFYDSFSFVPPTVNFISQYIMTVVNIIGFVILFYPVFFNKEGKFSIPPMSTKEIYTRIAKSLPNLRDGAILQKTTQNKIIHFFQFACVILFLFTVVGIVNTILNSFGIYSFVNFIFYILPIIFYIPFLICLAFLFIKFKDMKENINNESTNHMNLIRLFFNNNNIVLRN
jgi:hypothetical protein